MNEKVQTNKNIQVGTLSFLLTFIELINLEVLNHKTCLII